MGGRFLPHGPLGQWRPSAGIPYDELRRELEHYRLEPCFACEIVSEMLLLVVSCAPDVGLRTHDLGAFAMWLRTEVPRLVSTRVMWCPPAHAVQLETVMELAERSAEIDAFITAHGGYAHGVR